MKLIGHEKPGYEDSLHRIGGTLVSRHVGSDRGTTFPSIEALGWIRIRHAGLRQSRDLGGLHKDSGRAVGGNARMPIA